MGAVWGRRMAGVEDIDIQANSAYRYPPKSGNYFASHFFMGGEKFETPHPEGYLFGENSDLNFLGNRPVQFPYLTPAPHEPVKTLRSLVNIRKDSLRLVRYKDGADSPLEEGGNPRVLYGLEFTFDADARVAVTVYCQASEEFSGGVAVYNPRSPSLQSQTVYFKRGLSQHFSLTSFKIDFSGWKDEELNFDLDKGIVPLVIQAVVAEGGEGSAHAHVLLAAFEKHVDGSFSVKPLKQKQIVDRVSYLLQEIYGIENKNNQDTKPSDDENSDNSNECVVCLSDLRDTLILPCRHLCLCNSCADTLRYQANNCPICRLPFRALLQIRAVRRKPGPLPPISFSPVLAQSLDHDDSTGADNIPPGYEPISLLEALNGLCSPPPSAPLYEEISYSEGLPARGPPENSHHKAKHIKSTDSGLRSPSSPIHEEDEEVSAISDSERPAVVGSLSRDSSHTESVSAAATPEIVSTHRGSHVQPPPEVHKDNVSDPLELKEEGTQEGTVLEPDACSIGIDE
ncbi:mahogunin ring finger 1, E3 ubiquitin protein ligase S homeolog isoform X1 [Xenopus laevis]|uniref:E3 ubiquitin-protein ligase n=1 Tax=Xenopus laevis TaxID=8355 RepID=A0A8J0TW99_XENLA|nr:mahogunin ring finger 1, E3 ubiquitin protein ligase S homeolog isoform X1 [Xenopus laevis]XP_018096105.1 mahogunin ring finger 1, E3 ubiquitin protein ligase S homeolog isoform X1 [Xenopus laevis]XP_018096106.1 mahogunin ring finger 1, E3 ubiquitin protein ligase S homeolog isoform X1 [Xenopus laevis]XP_018096107.1 mahogunin ring finger 1, E3 ubiquitin protein ligase S homeolog isoform X1 [Xenopus laevis]XP_041433647.1 mahogunin ring finger 1, E3 ubiquitin protein ligase S homeolog isoform 